MQESTDIIIGYTLTCSTLYVLFTCLAWRIETHGSTCCAALYSKYSITGAYYCRVIAAISVWFGLSVVVTVVLRYIYHTWLNGQFNYFFFTSFMLALLKWGLAILLLLIRYLRFKKSLKTRSNNVKSRDGKSGASRLDSTQCDWFFLNFITEGSALKLEVVFGTCLAPLELRKT